MLHDGDCPLCAREVSFLQSKDARGAIKFVDIAAPDYRPEDNAGISYQEVCVLTHRCSCNQNGNNTFERAYAYKATECFDHSLID